MSKQTKADSDAPVKILGMELLWATGYVVRPEVLISQQMVRASRSKANFLDVTDVDVLGYRFDASLNLATMCIDCGAGKSRSPIERAFWVRGLKEAIDIDKVICVVGRAVEEEHRVAAYRFGTLLFQIDEFREYYKRLTNNASEVDFGNYYAAYNEWQDYLGNFEGAFFDFFRKDNWQREWDRIPVTVPGQLRKWQVNLDLSKPVHQHGLIELALLLSIGLVRVAIVVSETHPTDFKGTVRRYVMGGNRQGRVLDNLLKVVEDLERERSELKGELFRGEGRFDVPHLDELLDLVGRMSDNIGLAIDVPRYIQAFQLARLHSDIADFPQYLDGKVNGTVTKLALDVFRYLRIASESRDNFNRLLGSV